MLSLSPRSSVRVVPILAFAIVAGCGGGSDGTTDPGGNTNGVHLTAKVDGGAWVASNPSFINVLQVSPGQYTISGLQSSATNAITITISLANIRGPGTYPLGVGPQVPGGSVILANTTTGWASAMSGADGSITITSLSSTAIAGQFNFTVTGTAGPRTVTEGDFSLPVKQLAVIGAIPDNAGSTFTTSIGGTTWNAAFVQGSVTTSGATGPGSLFQIVTSNSTRGVSIILSGVTGAGTYALGNSGTVTRQMGVTNVTNPLSNTWSSIGAGSSGSVTITSMTATRVKGTFSAVLGPAPGLSVTGTVAVTNGVFDVGLP